MNNLAVDKELSGLLSQAVKELEAQESVTGSSPSTRDLKAKAKVLLCSEGVPADSEYLSLLGQIQDELEWYRDPAVSA